MDRIDLHVTVDSIDHKKLLTSPKNSTSDSSEIIRNRIVDVVATQSDRFNKTTMRNGNMNNRDIKKYARLSDDAKDFLDVAAKKLNLSARVYMKTVKVARTIADLEGSKTIEIDHVSEAVRYRPLALV